MRDLVVRNYTFLPHFRYLTLVWVSYTAMVKSNPSINLIHTYLVITFSALILSIHWHQNPWIHWKACCFEMENLLEWTLFLHAQWSSGCGEKLVLHIDKSISLHFSISFSFLKMQQMNIVQCNQIALMRRALIYKVIYSEQWVKWIGALRWWESMIVS